MQKRPQSSCRSPLGDALLTPEGGCTVQPSSAVAVVESISVSEEGKGNKESLAADERTEDGDKEKGGEELAQGCRAGAHPTLSFLATSQPGDPGTGPSTQLLPTHCPLLPGPHAESWNQKLVRLELTSKIIMCNHQPSTKQCSSLNHVFIIKPSLNHL